MRKSTLDACEIWMFALSRWPECLPTLREFGQVPVTIIMPNTLLADMQLQNHCSSAPWASGPSFNGTATRLLRKVWIGTCCRWWLRDWCRCGGRKVLWCDGWIQTYTHRGGVWNFGNSTQFHAHGWDHGSFMAPAQRWQAQSCRRQFHFFIQLACELHAFTSRPCGPNKKVLLSAVPSHCWIMR